ncbi:virulence protein RhuM/Fic/DOC family protein [Leptobacterium sp. I13]|uniref:virulence protein RhuM/Fic/DOC family protein n=1 Tax=Leptobacterium meishanense TaxID=3128904 RepID=UPI0030EE3DFB
MSKNEKIELKATEVVVYKPSDQNNEFQVIFDIGAETIWATEQQIADIFDRDRTVIGRHIKNIFKENELNKNSVCAKFAHTAEDGKTYQVNHYNLDVIISVGYRVKSKIATEFRKWATNKLRNYFLKGAVINERLLIQQTEKISQLEHQIDLLYDQAHQNQVQLTEGFLSIVTKYSKSFELLNKYDTEDLETKDLETNIIYIINYRDVKKAILELKKELIKKGEASDLFGNEKDKSFEGILGSISQTVFGKLAYPSIEEQAAQLLYSIIKGHAFSDGNKRIGSFVFVWFLEQNNFHLDKNGQRKINNNTLVTLALAVAQSIPEQREIIIQLIINLIKN